MTETKTIQDYINEVRALKLRLSESEETLEAIRTGAVDAFVVNNEDGLQVFSLKSADHNYRMLIEEMNEGALILSADSTIVYCNKSFAMLINQPMEDIIGRFFTDYVDFKYFDKVKTLFANATGEVSKLEIKLYKGSKKITVKLSLKYFSEKAISMLNMIVTDISQQKRSANKIKAYHKELEEKVVALKRSNTELEQFAYVASHDLKEPLRMISSFTTLLIKKITVRDDEMNEFQSYILEGIERMNALINDLLLYSRVGRTDIEMKKVNCNDIIAKAISNLQDSIKNTNAEITIHNLPTLYAVPTLLTQVFQNFIENSIKFNKDQQPPKIEICAVKKQDEWEFCITDNGIGIEPQFAERIFVIFQRLNNREKYPGSGIGLSITKKIIEFHGGKIWLDKAYMNGCRFYFVLPENALQK